MKFGEFSKAVEKREIPSILVFHGDEEYLKDRAFLVLCGALIPEGLEDLNLSFIDGKKTSADEIAAACQSFPFMAERRIVLVRDFAALESPRKKEDSGGSGSAGEEKKPGQNSESGGGAASGAQEAARLIEAVSPSVCLVFLSRGRVDKRTQWYKSLTKAGAEVTFDPLSEREAAPWVVEMARGLGKELSETNAAYIMKTGDGRLLWAKGEIEKLAAYVGDSPRIRREDIDAVCTQATEYRVFRMIDQMASGRTRQTMAAYRGMVTAGDSPYMLMAMVTRQLAARMWAMTLPLSTDESERNALLAEAARKLGVRDFVIKNAI
ncbi:MAG: DNA polymerase III subunit delta, partial [Clostridiales bacterium]|nr:DNA polymerase III subunit delta [Clostridiales bacterium]